MIGRVRGGADAEKRFAGGERVAIEQSLRGAAGAGLAADQWMLAAFAMPAEIGKRSVRGGNARVIFLDPAPHLGKQRVLQRLGRGERCLRISVLGFEIGADVGIEQARVAHHRLPARILEPGELVGEGNAVPHGAHRTRSGTRRPRREGRFGRRRDVHGQFSVLLKFKRKLSVSLQLVFRKAQCRGVDAIAQRRQFGRCRPPARFAHSSRTPRGLDSAAAISTGRAAGP